MFNLALAPTIAATNVTASRIAATGMAGVGAVSGLLAYDWSSGQPVDYAYIGHRAGFVAGVAAAFGAAGLLGYEIAATDWLGWTVSRVALFGTGTGGAWVFDDLLAGP
jgi:hypothetical protein